MHRVVKYIQNHSYSNLVKKKNTFIKSLFVAKYIQELKLFTLFTNKYYLY